MFNSIFEKIKRILSSNFLFDKSIRLLYVILSLYLGANFFSEGNFYTLQQINLFQSFLIFALGIPVNATLIRIGNANINYFKTLIPSVILYRFIIGIVSLGLVFVYFSFVNEKSDDIWLILVGLIPTCVNSFVFVDILPHIFNFEGRKNWQLIYIYLFMFVLKCLSMMIMKSLEVKIALEIIEAIAGVIWVYRNYLYEQISLYYIKLYKSRVIRLIKSSFGLFLNGIFSVFILRIDQFSLISLVDKSTLSIYMLIVSISSLFLTPMTLFSERIGFTLSLAKSKSLKDFHQASRKALWLFFAGGVILYVIFCFLVGPLAAFVFKRNIDNFSLISIILGTSIISNSVGMVFGQINSIMNGGLYTMKRTLIGCILLFFSVRIGFGQYGVPGVAMASAVSLFFTNICFWFFSNKIKRAIFCY
ncbi:hypothetical protein [Sphingobacterium detergens]